MCFKSKGGNLHKVAVEMKFFQDELLRMVTLVCHKMVPCIHPLCHPIRKRFLSRIFGKLGLLYGLRYSIHPRSTGL